MKMQEKGLKIPESVWKYREKTGCEQKRETGAGGDGGTEGRRETNRGGENVGRQKTEDRETDVHMWVYDVLSTHYIYVVFCFICFYL